MSQLYRYPSTPAASVSIPAIGPNGTPIPADSILIAGENPSGDLTPVQVNASGEIIADISGSVSGLATAANQVTEIASLASIDSKLTSPLAVTGPLTDAELRASAVPVSAASLPLPAGASTAANQATEIASLASIDSKLTSPLAVTGPLTDTELRASAVPVSLAAVPLPTGAATEATLLSFSDKSTSNDVVEAYDYRKLTYVGATERIDTITYRLGGSGGTIVAVQTFVYDGSNRLEEIVKT